MNVFSFCWPFTETNTHKNSSRKSPAKVKSNLEGWRALKLPFELQCPQKWKHCSNPCKCSKRPYNTPNTQIDLGLWSSYTIWLCSQTQVWLPKASEIGSLVVVRWASEISLSSFVSDNFQSKTIQTYSKTARWAKERSESNKRKSEHCAPIGKVTFWWGQLKTGMHWPNFKIIFLPWTFQTRLHDEIVMSYPWYEHAERVTID